MVRDWEWDKYSIEETVVNSSAALALLIFVLLSRRQLPSSTPLVTRCLYVRMALDYSFYVSSELLRRCGARMDGWLMTPTRAVHSYYFFYRHIHLRVDDDAEQHRVRMISVYRGTIVISDQASLSSGDETRSQIRSKSDAMDGISRQELFRSSLCSILLHSDSRKQRRLSFLGHHSLCCRGIWPSFKRRFRDQDTQPQSK